MSHSTDGLSPEDDMLLAAARIRAHDLLRTAHDQHTQDERTLDTALAPILATVREWNAGGGRFRAAGPGAFKTLPEERHLRPGEWSALVSDCYLFTVQATLTPGRSIVYRCTAETRTSRNYAGADWRPDHTETFGTADLALAWLAKALAPHVRYTP